eukprot:12210667-Alexandrium_andersonii.AAC.1
MTRSPFGAPQQSSRSDAQQRRRGRLVCVAQSVAPSRECARRVLQSHLRGGKGGKLRDLL